MGISREDRHKRRLTGGRRNVHQKKRKYEMGRASAMTKIGAKKLSVIRVRGGNHKYRALRLETGNFSWGSEVCTRRARILDVVYNASNNELVRTKTLVKNAIIQVDATAFRQWYEQHYGVSIGKSAKKDDADAEKAAAPKSDKAKKVVSQRAKTRDLDAKLAEQFAAGRLYACVSSRPGQSGRCDGYILEGKELEFYLRKMQKKKSTKK